jgi:2-polyprenyl-6-methoxyphenol hydroxylase-like FAD-dependent oxidoreductase
MRDQFDVVIVGGGIAGCGLATVLARSGKEVLLLEQTNAYPDIVRGEVMTQWGVKEAETTGLLNSLLGAGAHFLTRYVGYDELVAPEEAERTAADLSILVPGVPGQLALTHPRHRQALFDAAIASGAAAERGVRVTRIAAGAAPSVEFQIDGKTETVHARLVVGADGRNSTVRQACGIALEQDRPRNHMTGLLVENAAGWHDRTATFGTNNDMFFAIFPQGSGRIRLYGVWSLEQRNRFTGPDGAASFLSMFHMSCCPMAEHIARATPAGPLLTFLNNESRAARLAVDGALLIGDAGGWSDPVVGQGLASAHRDVRIVSDILLSTDDWSPATFAPYEAERRERERRIAHISELITRLCAEFDEPCRKRRSRYFNGLRSDPAMTAVVGAINLGPDGVPADAFTPDHRAYVLDLIAV